ncbi:Rhodanese-like domain-containing protein [Pisolithus croceorrhizus]|nr:Rhodanese-like domain-containing protein [Pisolithus croceorrhizus]KAI6166556.1 Rhodanese-like domain-containing protein [Pisolithus thermaeus]
MVKYISASELANVIQSDKKPWKDYLVVDVRDEDWIGGNITGSHNAPSQSFLTEVDKLMKDTKDIPMVVFHCRYSQERGPKAARVYEETRNILHKPSDGQYFEAHVLRGGFHHFGEKYKDDPKLVENWRDVIW